MELEGAPQYERTREEAGGAGRNQDEFLWGWRAYLVGRFKAILYARCSQRREHLLSEHGPGSREWRGKACRGGKEPEEAVWTNCGGMGLGSQNTQ